MSRITNYGPGDPITWGPATDPEYDYDPDLDEDEDGNPIEYDPDDPDNYPDDTEDTTH